jgi:hypothetical protein
MSASDRDAADYIDVIDQLLASKSYEWARPTLEGIRQTMAASGIATAKQRQAIDHVIIGRLKHDTGGS